MAAPLAYGPLTLPIKVFRQQRVIPGPSGVYNPSLGTADVGSVMEFLHPYYHPDSDVWYAPDPVTALDLPGRAVIRSALFEDPRRLRADRFVAQKPMRALVLLSADLEKSGRGALIRSSFINAENWNASSIPGCSCRLWIGTLRPN